MSSHKVLAKWKFLPREETFPAASSVCCLLRQTPQKGSSLFVHITPHLSSGSRLIALRADAKCGALAPYMGFVMLELSYSPIEATDDLGHPPADQ